MITEIGQAIRKGQMIIPESVVNKKAKNLTLSSSDPK